MAKPKQSGVYKIINGLTNDIYIGSSRNTGKRWYTHCWRAGRPEYISYLLYAAIAQYGIENFRMEIIEECKPIKEVLYEREQYYINTLKPAYNMILSASPMPPNLGNKDFHHSDESKKLMRKSIAVKRQQIIAERGEYLTPEGKAIAKVKRNARFTPERREQYSKETKRSRDLAEETRRLKADKVAQQFLPMILEMQNTGLGLTAIANCINERGFKTRRGSPWTDQTVRQILKRRPKPLPPSRGITTEVIDIPQKSKNLTSVPPEIRYIGWKN